MASSSIGVSPAESSLEQRRNLIELPRALTASILTRFGAVEILTSFQMVCKSWFEICKDPLMWRTIDMHNIGDECLNLNLEKMCRNAVDRSCGELVDINIKEFATDNLLKYITDRSHQIKRLRLAYCHLVSDEGLIEAIAKLPLLEELDLTLCSFLEDPLKALGCSCPRFKSLKLNCQAYEFSDLDPDEEMEFNEHVIAIGKNLPGLRHLQLIGNSMTNMGLEAILRGCPNLESLDLRSCLNIDLSGDLGKKCAERIKHLLLPNDSIKDYEFVAGLDNFLLHKANPSYVAGANFSSDECLELEDDTSDECHPDYYIKYSYSSGNDSMDDDDFFP